jgi:hypothetical protein
MAKSMAQRLEARSAALPVIAAALVFPASALYVIDTAIEAGWSKAFEYHLAGQVWSVVGIGALGFIAGSLMMRTSARLPIVGRIAAVAAAACIALPVVTFMNGGMPKVYLLAPFVIVATVAVIVRRLRIEREQIDAVDPAAGSELFSWKKSFAALRGSLKDVTSRITKRMVVGASIATGVFILAGGPVMNSSNDGAVQASATSAIPVLDGDGVTLSKKNPGKSLFDAPAVTVNVDIMQGQFGEIHGIAGLDTLPYGWKMTMVVRLVEAAPGLVSVTPMGNGSVTPNYSNNAGAIIATTTVTACEGTEPVGLRVEPQGFEAKKTGYLPLRIEPKLTYVGCD